MTSKLHIEQSSLVACTDTKKMEFNRLRNQTQTSYTTQTRISWKSHCKYEYNKRQREWQATNYASTRKQNIMNSKASPKPIQRTQQIWVARTQTNKSNWDTQPWSEQKIMGNEHNANKNLLETKSKGQKLMKTRTARGQTAKQWITINEECKHTQYITRHTKDHRSQKRAENTLQIWVQQMKSRVTSDKLRANTRKQNNRHEREKFWRHPQN